MSKQDDLVRTQYQDASNLNARIDLHRRFSTNRQDWFQWVFDHLELPSSPVRVLELGCGPGDLWQTNCHRIPATWQMTLCDLSPGMIEQARDNLRGCKANIVFRVADVQELPFEHGTFDAVVANHMLYHVPNLPAALAEIWRVLRAPRPAGNPTAGKLYAATNGQRHMQELNALIALAVSRASTGLDEPQAAPQDFQSIGHAAESFGLENGAAQLEPWFTDIRRYDFDNDLAVTEAQPLIAYVSSLSNWWAKPDNVQALSELRYLVQSRIAAEGSVHITKSTGLLVASRRG